MHYAPKDAQDVPAAPASDLITLNDVSGAEKTSKQMFGETQWTRDSEVFYRLVALHQRRCNNKSRM